MNVFRTAVRTTLGLILCWTLWGPAWARGSDLPDPADSRLTLGERFEALIARASQEQGQVRTLEARFVQHKESEMLLEPEEARGSFSFQSPDRVRWDFIDPSAMTLVIRDREMVTWYQDLNRVEEVDAGRHAERFLRLLGPGSSLKELQRYFTLSVSFPENLGEPYQIDLEPLSKRVEKRIQAMTIRLDPVLFVPIYLRYVEAGGTLTELQFEDLKINQGLSADRFELILPEGVERVRMGEDKK